MLQSNKDFTMKKVLPLIFFCTVTMAIAQDLQTFAVNVTGGSTEFETDLVTRMVDSNSLNINRNSIIEQAIGAFFGFVLALLSAWLTAFVAKRIKIYKLRKRVYIELAEVYNGITPSEHNATLLYYDCPIWDSIISSGILLDIGNNAFLQPLGEIYGQLNILRDLEQKMLEENEEQTPNEYIIAKRTKLISIIKESEHFKHIDQMAKELKQKDDLKINKPR